MIEAWKVKLGLEVLLFTFALIVIVISTMEREPIAMGIGMFILWTITFYECLRMKRQIEELEEMVQ